jgi:hypothetical protein
MTTRDAGDVGLAPDAPLRSLIIDMLHWLEPGPRPYAEVMDAWRTSCPRLTVWENALDQGLVRRETGAEGPIVVLTALGRKIVCGRR